jgi:hypothetical protein
VRWYLRYGLSYRDIDDLAVGSDHRNRVADGFHFAMLSPTREADCQKCLVSFVQLDQYGTARVTDVTADRQVPPVPGQLLPFRATRLADKRDS